MALRDVAAAVTRDTDKPVRQQLERLLASATFKQVDRLKRFLSFIVLESIGGRSTELKEYVIGVHVFGKEPSFDPRTDPIVRVQARRLRAKLVRYYQEEGASDEVIIDLPKGGYAPVFKRRERSATAKRSIASALVSRTRSASCPSGTMAADRSSTPSVWVSGRRSSTTSRDSRTCGFLRSRTPPPEPTPP
jgi:serine/threonine-protein kinase